MIRVLYTKVVDENSQIINANIEEKENNLMDTNINNLLESLLGMTYEEYETLSSTEQRILEDKIIIEKNDKTSNKPSAIQSRNILLASRRTITSSSVTSELEKYTEAK